MVMAAGEGPFRSNEVGELVLTWTGGLECPGICIPELPKKGRDRQPAALLSKYFVPSYCKQPPGNKLIDSN